MSVPFTTDLQRPKTIPFTQIVGIVQFRDDFLQRVGLYIVGITIDNQDATNAVTFRTVPSGVLLTIPPNALGVVENEIHEFIEVNPDPATGDAIVTLSLAEPAELRRLGLIP